MNQKTKYILFTDCNFKEEVLESSETVLVRFGAESYGGLHIVVPIMDEVLPDYKGRIKVGRLDIDQSNETARQYRIHVVPTLLFFKDGFVVDYLIGIFRKKELTVTLNAVLGEGG